MQEKMLNFFNSVGYVDENGDFENAQISVSDDGTGNYTITLGTIQVFFRIMNCSLIQMLFYSFLRI